MKTKKLLIATSFLIILLLSLDLFTGIFYWNRLNLKFDPDNFNDIVTPIVSILALLTYGATLFHLISQNQIALSQNLKPFYEKELDELFKKASIISVEVYNGTETKHYNLFDFVEGIKLSYLKLQKNKSFMRDIKQLESGKKFNVEEIENRNYFKYLDIYHQFSKPNNPIILLLNEVVNLYNNVSNSKLIEEDKFLIQEKIQKIFLSNYLRFIDLMINDTSNKYPIFPVIYVDGVELIHFKKLSDTQFIEAYKSFKMN